MKYFMNVTNWVPSSSSSARGLAVPDKKANDLA